jgi:hypothetical protein
VLAALATSGAGCALGAGAAVAQAPGKGSKSQAAGPPAQLHVGFAPKRLGAATTISFTIVIDPSAADQPPALSAIDLSYPRGLGFATSGLGLASCDPARLQSEGASACPANARMGGGDALARVAFGPMLVSERVGLSLFAGPSPNGYLHLLVLASGSEPVEARIVMTGVLLPGHLKITVPPVPGLPGAGDVALTQVHATLGGALTYYERVRDRLVAYRPKGVSLPPRCPRGGWQVGATLAFAGGAFSRAEQVIGCPARSG